MDRATAGTGGFAIGTGGGLNRNSQLKQFAITASSRARRATPVGYCDFFEPSDKRFG